MSRTKTNRRPAAQGANEPPRVRCAIYTRKSTDEGLDREFNTLDAQREAGEAYIRSQTSAGWMILPQRYDDGGFSGGSTDRPALRRLLADVEEGLIDCVVVYKVDRLSRSLLDFAQLIRQFEDRGVAFVSVTQQFHTASSMGRLVLNVLLSFAQFEREIIGERTRDKIAATRRKGKWCGGRPVLGYQVDRAARRLVVVPEEADRVRAIFAVYLESGGLLPAVRELTARGWCNKSGATFTRTSLYHLLTNVTYLGQVRYREEIHPGEHEALIEAEVWRRVQSQLARNRRAGQGRMRSGAILGGLLQCRSCGAAMTPTQTTRSGRQYRYYACGTVMKRGRDACSTRPVPAGMTEAAVVDRLKAIGRDPRLLAEVLENLAKTGVGVNPDFAASTLAEFDPLWDVLTAAERARVLALLLERVEYNADAGTLSLMLRPNGFEAIREIPSREVA